MPPVVCRFWQQGNCRNGNSCKFLHSSNQNPQPVSNGNRFAALQDTSAPRSSNNGYQGRAPPTTTLPYGLDKSAILVDLTSERPQWILSAYGPGRNAPAQLFGGPMREQSFEEMRLLHYMATSSGNPQQSVLDAEKLFQASEQQIQAAVNNIDGAINFVVSSEKDHPNRIDVVRDSQIGAGAHPNPLNNQSSFQQAANSGSNPFGGGKQTPGTVQSFGAPSAPAFGTPTATGGAFGQSSALGRGSSPFGAANPAFGAPTQHGSASGFGQPSVLGQKPNPFGAPATNPPTPAATSFSSFAGTPNPFAQNPSSSAPFGAPTQTTTPAPFGAPTQPAQSNPFGQPPNQNLTAHPFGGSSVLQPNPIGGSTTTFGEPSPARNPFGASTQQPINPNPFGQSHAAPQTTPFGASSTTPVVSNAFNGASAAAHQNPFGAPLSASATTNPFGKPPSNPTLNVNSNPFGQPPAVASLHVNGNPFPAPQSQPLQGMNGHTRNIEFSEQHPQLSSYSSKEPSGKLTMFKGRRVVYRGEQGSNGNWDKDTAGEPGFIGQDGTWEKIWFPDGPPIFNKDTEVDEALYDQKTEAAYLRAKQTGSFQGGIMPLLPPKRKWCHWDF